MHFHQRRHAVALGQFAEIAHLALGENRRDQQDRVRAVGRRLMNMIRVDGEVFAAAPEAAPPPRADSRSDKLPRKCFSSVSTESAAAPPCFVDRAIDAGSKSVARMPLLGEAFLISAMTAGCAAVSAARKSRRCCDRIARRAPRSQPRARPDRASSARQFGQDVRERLHHVRETSIVPRRPPNVMREIQWHQSMGQSIDLPDVHSLLH